MRTLRIALTTLGLAFVMVSVCDSQTLIHKFTPNDPEENGTFGTAIGMNDSYVYLSSHAQGTPTTINKRAVYKFDRVTGAQVSRFVSPRSRALGGGVIRGDVGVFLGDVQFASFAGEAFIYDLDQEVSVSQIRPDDPNSSQFFGFGLDANDQYAVVGATGTNSSSGLSDTGAAYVFDLSTGDQVRKITVSNERVDSQFGQGLAVHGNHALIGADRGNLNESNYGIAYIFDLDTGQQLDSFQPAGGSYGDVIGGRLAFNDDYVLLGATADDEKADNAGAVYVFDRNTGQQLYKLFASDFSSQAFFGSGIQISGKTAFIGSFWATNENGFRAGAVYAFDLTTGEEISIILPPDGMPGDEFGSSLRLYDGQLLVSAVTADVSANKSGAAYLFDVGGILAFPEPYVSSAELNIGEQQRSAVESISIVFDGDVELADGAVSVVQRSTQTEETFETVATNVSTQLVDNQTIASVQFESHVRNSNNALVDGNYQLTLTGSLVTKDGVSMSEDFVFGNVEADGFYSFYGDSDGNRTVNIFDLLAFRQSYNTVFGDTSYAFFMDFQANGMINVFDLLPFRTRYGTSLPFVFGGSSSMRRKVESFKTTTTTLRRK